MHAEVTTFLLLALANLASIYMYKVKISLICMKMKPGSGILFHIFYIEWFSMKTQFDMETKDNL